MTSVALPPGVYNIIWKAPDRTGPGSPPVSPEYALVNPDGNGQEFDLAEPDPTDPNQQFFVDGSGLIFASFNRQSFAYAQTPGLLQEAIKRSTMGVSWIINVTPVANTANFKGYILAPDENKYYWNPNKDKDPERVILLRTKGVDWIFKPADTVTTAGS